MNDIDKAEKAVSKFNDEQRLLLRRKAKSNLFFLAYGILGYSKLSSNLHLEICKWHRKTLLYQFREILLPRSHYKSTIETISDSIQIVLPDDIGDQPYPRNLGTNCRLLISHETSEAAARFLLSITQHFTGNPLLMGLFPECVPNPRVHRINKLELELPREAVWSEPTIDTIGVGGRGQGRHYNYIKCDDIFGVAARDSRAEKESTISWVNNLQSYLISPKTDHIDWIGTRYSHDDVYAHIHKQYGSSLIKYIRSVQEWELDVKGKKTGKKIYIFPEEFDDKSTEVLRKDRQVWNAQYVNNPFEGGSLFQEEWLKYFTFKTRKKLFILEGTSTREVDTDELDIVFLIDPAMSGLAGFIVSGTDSNKNIYILEAVKKEWSPPEFINFLFQMVLKWRPRTVAIEDVLFSGLYEHWLLTEMIQRGIKFKIDPIKTGNKEKESRVLSLANYFSAGQIYFNSMDQDIIEEFKEFGATSNYHLLDAMSQGTKKDKNGRLIWRFAPKLDRIENQRIVEEELLRQRDPQTGYGAY